MLPLVTNYRTAWNDYFPGTTPSNYFYQLYTSKQTRSEAYLYILNSLFRSIASSDYGGALYCNSATFMLIESTSFFSCKLSGGGGQGGAIYFYNSGSQCVLYGVCGYDCSTTTDWDYQFAIIYVSNSASVKNYVNYTSISRCVNEVSGAYSTFYLCYGNICCPSVNTSMNRCIGYSGIYCNPSIDSNSVTCSLTYSTIADNIDINYICIYLSSIGANKEMKYCNIIRNTQSSTSCGTISTWGNLIIEDSCILENTATNIFYQGSSSYTITLTKCTVDQTSSNVNLIIQNTVTKSFILALNHIFTQYCNAQYDSAGNQVPVPPHPSSSEKQIHCYTYVRLLYYNPQGNLVSLISVLLALKLLPQ
jgi:hypothetical protein